MKSNCHSAGVLSVRHSVGLLGVNLLPVEFGPSVGCGPYLGRGLEVPAPAPQEVQSFLRRQAQSNKEIPSNNTCCESLCMDKEKIRMDVNAE